MHSRLGNRSRPGIVAIGLLIGIASSCAAADEPGDHDALDVRLTHKTMTMRVGYPAVVLPGDAFPSVELVSRARDAGTLDGEVVREDDGVAVKRVAAQELRPGQKATLAFEGKAGPGRYRLTLQFVTGDRPVFRDAYYFSVLDPAGLPEGYSLVAHPGKDGRLVYTPDYRGNRIPDFSTVGYLGGDKEIPDVPVKVTLAPEPGDATARIQRAIDQVSALAPDKEGFRGAVLLKKGVYEVGTLKIKASGVVVRGEGPGKDRRVPLLDPAAGLSRDAFLRALADPTGTVLVTGRLPFSVAGAGGVSVRKEPAAEVLDSYVPVGAVTFSVRNPGDFRAGDKVLIQRRGNEAWVNAIGMDRIPGKKPWPPRDTGFERVVTAVAGDRLTVNAPIVTAIEKRWGGGSVSRYDDPGRISRVGVENLRMIQYCAADAKVGLGNVRGAAVTFANVTDAWVRDAVAEHFYDNGAIVLGAQTRNITVRDSSILLADEKYTEGYVPRYGFKVGEGGRATLHLVENCYALNCRHAFYVDHQVTGPNVFHNSTGEKDLTNSEPHHLWSSGGLYDNVNGSVALMNRLTYGSGHGWAAANYVAWNTRGRLICERPPTAQNWAIGHVGFRLQGPFHDWRPPKDEAYDGGGHGHWDLYRNPVRIGVEASDHEFTNVPEGTLDDHPYGYWMTDRRNAWIQYDLRRPQKVSALKMSFPTFSPYVDAKKRDQPPPERDRVYLFDIAVSDDGKTWRTVHKDGKGAAGGHDVLRTYEFPEVEARYVRVVAKGSDVGKTGREGSTVFHLSRVRVLPEPRFDPVKAVPEVKPASLFRQQVKERAPR
ncbi:discoidin domain-containing protein [Gemmata sp.]|uniref:discoidin domain-containing protein n=1 Tax=Gemmata sp. TaxID=1914242 RepID=UPI003F703C97